MTHEELMEEQYLLEKAAHHAIFEVLQDEGNKVIAQVSHSFEGNPTNNWKMTIEKVKE